MRLWLVRHAQPLVQAGICYGRLDLPADAGATLECAGQLAALLPAGLAVIASPLQRCEQLAQALCAQRPDLAYKTDARLQEMDFGDWTADFANYAAGHGGESVAVFMKRVGSAFDALQGQGDTLWITHAGVIRAVALLAQGVRQIECAGQWPLDAPKYGQWRLLNLNPS